MRARMPLAAEVEMASIVVPQRCYAAGGPNEECAINPLNQLHAVDMFNEDKCGSAEILALSGRIGKNLAWFAALTMR